MKVIALNGSPRLIGNTGNALNDVLDEIEKEGIEVEQIQLYAHHLERCNDCRSCMIRGDGRCIIEEDDLNDILDKLRQADGIILASPCYYGSCSSQMQTFLERAGLPLETGDMGLKRKVGAAMVVNAHDGGSLVHAQLVGWMLRNEMVVVGGNPAPILNALNSPQYLEDKQGMRAVTRMAREIAWAVLRLNGLDC